MRFVLFSDVSPICLLVPPGLPLLTRRNGVFDGIVPMKKSSFHFVSGDGKMRRVAKRVYRLSAALEKLTENRCQLVYSHDFYRAELDEARLVYAFGEQIRVRSPSRILCFDFLLTQGAALFGPQKSVLDLGCGTGIYAEHLGNAFGYRAYQGLDHIKKPQWEGRANEKTRYDTATLGTDWINVDDVDVVFSQSVLEHVRYDAATFEHFRARVPRKLQHLHFMPAIRSYAEYGRHGFRRYGTCTINRLLSHPSISGVKVFSLGNWLSRSYTFQGDTKRARVYDGVRPVAAYDASLSQLANMIRNRDALVATRPDDAAFYAVTFEQDIPAGA